MVSFNFNLFIRSFCVDFIDYSAKNEFVFLDFLYLRRPIFYKVLIPSTRSNVLGGKQ